MNIQCVCSLLTGLSTASDRSHISPRPPFCWPMQQTKINVPQNKLRTHDMWNESLPNWLNTDTKSPTPIAIRHFWLMLRQIVFFSLFQTVFRTDFALLELAEFYSHVHNLCVTCSHLSYDYHGPGRNTVPIRKVEQILLSRK